MRLRISPDERFGTRSWVWQLMFFIIACVTVLIAFQAFRQPLVITRTESTDALAPLDEAIAMPARNDLAADEFRSPPPDLATADQERPRSPEKPLDRTLRADLSSVRDNMVGVRFDESAAFFDLLQEARRTVSDDLDARVRHDVQYANLMADPAAYRGQAIALAGELWRLTPFRAARNRYGLETLYEAWIVTPDSAPRAYRVVTSQLGPGLQPEVKSRVPVFVTGYFFKREGYATLQGVEAAPTILGTQLSWDETVAHPASMATFPPWMMGLIIAGGLILTATLVSLTLSERRSERRQPRYEPMRADTMTALAALPPYSIASVLMELEELDRARQFETFRPPHKSNPIPLWTKGEQSVGDRASHAVDLPTPTPPTRQFRHGWKERWTGKTPPQDANGQ